MEPTLTWIDYTARDRDRMRRVLDLFSEQGTVDELGLGTLRDVLANALFPGTSTILTRLRYMLFVPWLYQGMQGRRTRGGDTAKAGRDAEVALIDALRESDGAHGVIGARSRAGLTRLPSAVYWAGLVRWGIFVPAQSQSWFHTHFERLVRGADLGAPTDDPGIAGERRLVWHPRLPRAPGDFPGVAGFDLTRDEAEFLRGRLEERCQGTLLAWLATEGGDDPADAFWDDPDVQRVGPDIARVVELARRFSLHVEGGALLYNLMLAERRAKAGHADDGERVDGYRNELDEWAAQEAHEAPFDPDALWRFVAMQGGRSASRQKSFVEAWTHEVTATRASIVNNAALRRLIEMREAQLKGPRARLANASRLLDWSGRVGVGRLSFRWPRVRQLMMDLHAGLAA